MPQSITNAERRPQLNTAEFRHQAVRDLAWSCFSTPLMRDLPESQASPLLPELDSASLLWLKDLDHNPKPLHQALAQRHSTRLGLYFEALWLFYLNQHPDWELLGHNLQVSAQGKTLGAFDFLCRYRDQYWHLEAAVKLYLGVPDARGHCSNWNQWWGPKCNDRLDIKLERLAQHQLQLGDMPEGRTQLDQLADAGLVWHKGLILKGYFFYPAKASCTQSPSASHPEHLRGEWWHLEDFLARDLEQKWRLLPRGEWLAEAFAEQDSALLSGEDLREQLRRQVGLENRPQLLARMGLNGALWTEQERLFVVPNGWPNCYSPN